MALDFFKLLKRTHQTGHRGATMVECAVALPVVLLVLFGMLDLGLAAARYNSLAEASRRVARETIIHGTVAGKKTSGWGPNDYQGNAADGSKFAVAAAPVLIAMPSTDVSIRVNWIDGSNMPHDRVQVEMTYEHKPLVPRLFVWGPLNLRATSTMRIVN
jgi:Flp pilus assembly protein TadG